MQRLGNLIRHEDTYELRFTRRLGHPPDRVFKALLDADDLAAWFPTTIEGDHSEGARLTFSFRAGEGPPFEGEMLVCDPPRLLEFRWGEDTLRFELEPDGDGTRLTLTDTLAELGKAARDGAGWHVCLDALEARLDGATPTTEWQAVHPRYVEEFGPDAATIGPPGS
jgi:uncharacterized protein YndB with AHSA1/START domain